MMIFNLKSKSNPVQLTLNGMRLPWVGAAKYLGCRWTNENDGFSADVSSKKGRYIAGNVSINHEFGFAHPAVRCKINQIYNGDFYGSNIWELNSKPVLGLINAWSTSVRIMWGLPRQTHRKFLEHLGGQHVASKLAANHVGFIQFLARSNKRPVMNMLFRCLYNFGTRTARNTLYVGKMAGISSHSNQLTKVAKG